MVALLGTLLLAFPQQSPAPFEFTLPENYEDFAQVAPEVERWSARRGDGLGVFTVEHLLIATPGGNPAAVARELRDFWLQGLQGLEPKANDWSGRWGGFDGAGVDIRFTRGGRESVVLERVLLLGEHLVHGLWEGPAAQREQALEALASFQVPAPWIPVPPPEVDPWSGLGEAGVEVPFPGEFRVHVDLTGLPGQQVVFVEVVWDGPDGMESGGWLYPPGATPVERESQDGDGVRYRLAVDPQSGAGAALGMARPLVGPGIAALDAAWVAVPRVLLDSPVGFRAPAWTLRLTYPATLTVFSHAPGTHDFVENGGYLRGDYPRIGPGRAWPYFLAGAYKPRKAGGRTWHLRLDAKATTPDEAVRGVTRLESALAAWLPHASQDVQVASFPGIGDRTLPGLLVLDESLGWFNDPLDAGREGLTQRTWLARTLSACTFGAGLRGVGSAAPFLEASLAEYGAWRLLEAEWPEDAAALEAWWAANEKLQGPLPMPLSMMPPDDSYGARRLQSRGARVWHAIEKRAGRETLDTLLDGVVAARVPWSSEDLRTLLEARTEEDWKPFFRDHVYGRLSPTDDE